MLDIKPFATRLAFASLFLATILAGSAADSTSGSALSTQPDGWVNIQPAPDLAGWTRVAIPPTNQLGRAQWHVDSARQVLVCDGDGGHEMLRYDKELGDAIFHVEFCFIPVISGKTNYNSGVFVRNSADGVVWHQAQLTPDGGYLFGVSPVDGTNKRFRLRPSEMRMKPAGEWNTLEVTARGKILSVWFNGALTCTFDNCQIPRGYIAVESEGYRVEFRNLQFKNLD